MRWISALLVVLCVGVLGSCTSTTPLSTTMPMRLVPDTRKIVVVDFDYDVMDFLDTLYAWSKRTQQEYAGCLFGRVVDDTVLTIDSVRVPTRVWEQTENTVGFDCADGAIGYAHTHPVPSQPSHNDAVLLQRRPWALAVTVVGRRTGWVLLRELSLQSYRLPERPSTTR